MVMKRFPIYHRLPETDLSMRLMAEQAFSRAAGAPHIGGNRVRLLKDARENYPAWLEAMESARETIHFENYIVYEVHHTEAYF